MNLILRIIGLAAAALFCGSLTAQTDVELIIASYFGGSGAEGGGERRVTATVPSADGGWTMGSTTSSFDYWVSDDALIANRPGPFAIALTRFDQNGTPIYSTFLGGSGQDTFTSLAGLGDSLIVAGSTSSADYPITEGAHDSVFPGDATGFLTCVDPEGGLVWSTYFGRDASANATKGVHVSADDFVYLTGITDDNTLGTPGVHMEVYPEEFFFGPYLARFDRNGNLDWCTYYARVIEGTGTSPDGTKIYAYSSTGDQGAISTPAHQPEFGGGESDAFLSCFDAETGTLLWETYYGGEGDDWIGGISVADDGLIYIAGITWSASAISTEGVHQMERSGDADAFLACFDSEGQQVWGTYFGGEGFETGNIPRIRGGAVYLAGFTNSQEGIAAGNPVEAVLLGPSSNYLSKFNRTTGTLEWATYIGSTQSGNCRFATAELLADERLLLTGSAAGACTEFITQDAWQPTYGGGNFDWWYAVYSENTVSTSVHMRHHGFSLFPNPTADAVTLKSQNVQEDGIFILHDISGRAVLQGTFRGSGTQIRTGHLPAGLYLLRAESAQGSAVIKLVKE